jgi:hypothetical protein
MQLRLSKRVLLAACAAVLVVSGGAAAAPSAPSVGHNTNHDVTYGKASLDRQGLAESDFSDLVAVVGDHGVEGYVRSRELFRDPNDDPATPEAALAMQAKAEDRVLPVFAADGRAQVDTFTVWGPNHDVPRTPLSLWRALTRSSPERPTAQRGRPDKRASAVRLS